MSEQTKLIVILGITGNQGHSVAQRFLKDPTYRIRGLTRNTNSSTASSLKSQGIEIVQVNLDDPATLAPAFKNANIIFSVTNYWEPFFRPDCRARASEQGISCAKFAYDVEYQQSKNIADAAALTVDTLDDNGFLVSTLSSARECSGGRLTDVYHFDAKADVFPGYVKEKYPELAKKMSCVQTGTFMTSFRLAPEHWFFKQPDTNTFKIALPMSPDKGLPFHDVNADTGNFVYAVSKMPPGKEYMAAGTTCSWTEYARVWSEVTGQKCEYEETTLDEMIDKSGDREAGKEIGIMFVYSSEPGYDGGVKLVQAEDMQKEGIECPMTTLEEFMRKQDWSEVLNR